MFRQNLQIKPIADFIFPIGKVIGTRFYLEGTAFFIGDKGFAVTAGHVVDALRIEGEPFALFNFNGKWDAIPIIDMEGHPIEDVAVIKLRGKHWKSLCEIKPSSEFASREYETWGYPENVAQELKYSTISADDADMLIRPDMIYDCGHIRRRISRELSASIYRGSAFYELSSVAGSCCSGAPLVLKPRNLGPFQVFGVYIGESTGDRMFAVGYGTRLNDIADWKPTILRKALHEVHASAY